MRRGLLAFVATIGVACGGASADLPPHGEALFVVDTDLPVPTLAGRLRVDVYSEEGVWLDSRDIGRSDPRDWPASFSVFSDDDARPRRALVRLRAYPEGVTRAYAGEVPPVEQAYVAPRVAASLDDLCANAPLLPVGQRVTLRQGADPIAQHLTTAFCPTPAVAGAVAARVEIKEPGAYRFSVAGSDPYLNKTTLSLRSSCADAGSQIACRRMLPTSGAFSPGHFARFDATLAPGTYWLVSTGAVAAWPADTTLEVMPLEAELPPVAADAPPLEAIGPRLVQAGADRTPTTEPAPTATVERLVLVELAPGVRGSVHVTLRGACAGTPARLGPNGTIELASAATCVDTTRARVPLAPTPLDPALSRGTSSEQGTFGRDEPCAAEATSASRVCVPGGVFLFGSPLIAAGPEVVALSPQRIAVMPRFWLDRYEYTVARLRSALARGLVLRDKELYAHEAPMPTVLDNTSTYFDDFCTWSAAPMGREDFPLNCMSWRQARELCRFDGGDLPTEAEWEYAATAAGRRFKSTFPWGETTDTCARGVFGRFPTEYGGLYRCEGAPFGPAAVTASDASEGRAGDVSPQGIVGLGGNVVEWVLDASSSFRGACWQAADLVSPRCFEEDAPQRSFRGAAWTTAAQYSVGRGRSPSTITGYRTDVTTADPQIGFRCAYAEASP